MNYLYFIFIIILVAIIYFIVSHIQKLKKLERDLRESFGKPPKKQEYSLASIETYNIYKEANTSTENYIDDITWNDLDMDKVFKRINACNTSIGEEYLYNYLHEPQFEQSQFSEREAFISSMDKQPEKRLKIQMFLARLGKSDFNGISDLIYNLSEKALKFSFIHNILSILPFLSAIPVFIDLHVGIMCLIASISVNTAVYLKTKRKIEMSLPAVQYFLSMIWCCNKLLKIWRIINNIVPFAYYLSSV